MKILLIGNYLPDRQQSMIRFAELLESGLSQLGHAVKVIRPQPGISRLKASATGAGKWLGYIDKFIVFPRSLPQAISQADVVHICDHSNAIYTRYLQKVPHLVTCHDVLAIRSALGEIPQNRTGWTGKQLQRLILNGLNRAQRVVCDSQNTENDLRRISSLSAAKTSVVYVGLNYPYTPMETGEAKQRLANLGIASHVPFLLHVGANHWYKNRSGLLSIFYHLSQKVPQAELSLVFVGEPLNPELRQLIASYNLSHKVIELSNVDSLDLRAIYSSATALLFPSLQEGFGWPVIEAQACGCPVFASHRAPMTEVGGDAAIYIDPEQPQAAAEQIASYLPNMVEWQLKGFVNVQRFQPENMIASYLEIYQEVIREKSVRSLS
jgi:glycosyltransferase involved in cell wall biosynthesis